MGADRFLKPCTKERTSDASFCKEITWMGVLDKRLKIFVAHFAYLLKVES